MLRPESHGDKTDQRSSLKIWRAGATWEIEAHLKLTLRNVGVRDGDGQNRVQFPPG
jgi:hypothetical protein